MSPEGGGPGASCVQVANPRELRAVGLLWMLVAAPKLCGSSRAQAGVSHARCQMLWTLCACRRGLTNWLAATCWLCLSTVKQPFSLHPRYSRDEMLNCGAAACRCSASSSSNATFTSTTSTSKLGSCLLALPCPCPLQMPPQIRLLLRRCGTCAQQLLADWYHVIHWVFILSRQRGGSIFGHLGRRSNLLRSD